MPQGRGKTVLDSKLDELGEKSFTQIDKSTRSAHFSPLNKQCLYISRKSASLITRLLTEHIPFNAYLKRNIALTLENLLGDSEAIIPLTKIFRRYPQIFLQCIAPA